MINTCCCLSPLLYSIPAFYLFLKEEYILAFLFTSLTIFAFLNHLRPYRTDPYFDFIDCIDRLLIVVICIYYIYLFYECIVVWIALIYMVSSYFLFIPRIKCDGYKFIIHSTFHLITMLTAVYLIQLYKPT